MGRSDLREIENHVFPADHRTTDLGDIRLEFGAPLRGRVVDSSGAAVPETTIVLRHQTFVRNKAGWTQTGWVTVETDANGLFAAVPPGTGAYFIDIPEHRTCTPRNVTIDDNPPPELTITVERFAPGSVIAGRVTDLLEKPLPGVQLLLTGRTPPTQRARGAERSAVGHTVTDAGGRFRFVRMSPADVDDLRRAT
ncbi:MAG: carboxypeptidase regulatory-like domain-containing protein [Planctomycetes bacterium]|nr:carboxypeptidase regulatory-like domain-containing protein [Planctomycetota bacterium]